MWARVAELRIDISLTEKKLLCLTQTSWKENKDLIKELELTKVELAKVGLKGLKRREINANKEL